MAPRWLLLPLLIVAAFVPASAQPSASIEGRVVDASTRAPLPGVHVIVQPDAGANEVPKGTITDRDGQFRLDDLQRGTYVLTASMVGFESFVTSVDVRSNKVSVVVQLTESAVHLDEVVVTAAGFEQLRRDAPASITVLGTESLRQRRSSNLAEMLFDVEGIDIGGTAGKTGGLNISMRGMPSDYTLVLIDGRRQNSAGNITPNGFGDTSTSFLPPTAAIERVEIIRGPMSTLYGSDAMGGVINIITRGVGSRWSGSLATDMTVQEQADYGNIYSIDAAVLGPIVPNLLGLSMRGGLRHREAASLSPTGVYGEETVISTRGPSPVEGNVQTFGAKLTFTPSQRHDVWLELDDARQSYDNSSAQLGTLDRPDASPPSFSGYGPELQFNRSQATLAHTWRFNAGVLQSSLMRNRTETLGRTIPPGTPGGPPGSGLPNKEPGSARTLESDNTILDSKLIVRRGDHALSVGGQIWNARMVDGVALGPFEHTQWSVFAEDEWRFIPSLALTAGLRRDDHSVFGGHVSPRAYLVWNATPTLTLKGGVSQGYKTPRVEQLVDGIIGFTAQGRTATIGTPSLKPETSTTTEVTAFYGNVDRFTASITFFNNLFDNKITTGTPVANCTFAGAPNRAGCLNYGDFPGQEFFAQSVNVDEAVTRGMEAGVRIPAGVWTLSSNYTYTYSEQLSGENEGLPLTNTPRHMVNGNLSVQPSQRITGWLRGEYRSSRARRTTVAEDPAYAALGDYRAYSLFHLGGSYAVNESITISATAYNLLNKDFLRYGAYEIEPTDDNPSGIAYTNLYNNHQEGRRIWMSVDVRF